MSGRPTTQTGRDWSWSSGSWPDPFFLLFVAAFEPGNACRVYRTDRFAEALNASGYGEGKVTDRTTPSDELRQFWAHAHVVTHQRPRHASQVKALRSSRLDRLGALGVVEDDDQSFDVSPLNTSYVTYGFSEVTIERGGKRIYLWRDGVTRSRQGVPFEIERNFRAALAHLQSLQEADLVTVAGPGLKKFYAQLNPNVVIVPNYLDFKQWVPLPLPKDRWIRFGWQGGSSHYQDWIDVCDGIEEAMAAEPRLRLVLYGQHFHGIFRRIDPRRMDLIPWVHLDAHPLQMARLNLDFGLIPLRDDEFGYGKSWVKWTEYSALRIPTIASRAPIYDVIEDGVTGFRAGHPKEWRDRILLLAHDERLRRAVGEAAWRKNVQEFSVEKGLEDLLRVYGDNLLRKRRGEFLDGRELRPARGAGWWCPPSVPLRALRGEPGVEDGHDGSPRSRSLRILGLRGAYPGRHADPTPGDREEDRGPVEPPGEAREALGVSEG